MKNRKREGPKANSLKLDTRYLNTRVKYGMYVSTGPKEGPPVASQILLDKKFPEGWGCTCLI